MFRNILLADIAPRMTKLTAAIAISLMAAFAASEVQAQQYYNGGSSCQQGRCVTPPQSFCCQPKLGFLGEMNCHGLLILHVNHYSQAEAIGLRPGDVIAKVNGRRVTSHAGFQRLLRDALIYNGGHVDLLVKKPYGYPSAVVIHVDIHHTCGRGH